MTRTELIDLAVKYGWQSKTSIPLLLRGHISIYPGDQNPAGNQTIYLYEHRQNNTASCLLSDLQTGTRPWIIGPFGGKFFSLKSQRFI